MVGGYLLYEFWYKKPAVDIWQVIPSSAIVVYESPDAVKTWNQLQTKPVWSNLKQIPFYQEVDLGIATLDSLPKEDDALEKVLKNRNFICSLHMVSREAFDFLFFVRVNRLKDQEILTQVLDHYQSDSQFQFLQRNYQDFTINEFKKKGEDQIFSYILHEDHFIGSFSPFLVEGVIRNFKDKRRTNFKDLNPSLSKLKKLENDDGNLYVNAQKIPQLFSVFSTERDRVDFEPLKHLAQSTFFDLEVNEEGIRCSGFTLTDPTKNQFLGNFLGQKPQEIRLKRLLPNRTALLYHFSYQDPKKWQQTLTNYWKKHQPRQITDREQLKTQYNFESGNMGTWIGNEIGLAVLESINPRQPDRLAFVKVADPNQALNQFNRLTEQSAAISSDTLYRESYAGMELREIKVTEFPSKLLGSVFKGFPQSYFLLMDDYIIIGNNVQVLKDLIRDIEREDVWSKSVSKNKFLESTLKEANVSVMVDMDRFWSLLEAKTTPKWKNFMDSFRSQLRKFDLAALQFSDVGDKSYTNLVLHHQNLTDVAAPSTRYQFVQKVPIQTPITSKPFVVRNHLNNSREVLVQDEQNYLYLISNDGRLLWRDSLPGPIRGQISQVDFYKNGKLQYLLATDKALHLIDRTGQDVERYPVEAPTEATLRNVAAIDYDNSKNYRFVASDGIGGVYLFSREGDLLDGWNPRRLKYQLNTAPFHLRVRGKDCIVAVQENGVVNILNRRGELYPGFPVDLKGDVTSPLYVEIGTDFDNTYFTAITQNGELVKFNLNGSTLEKKQFYKPNRETLFGLAADALSRDFIIYRQTSNRLGILDREENLILEKDYLTPGQLQIQYYYFSSGNKVFAITDNEQQFTYLYDQEGRLINDQPVESSQRVGLMYFEKLSKYHLYSVYDRQFSIRSFNKD